MRGALACHVCVFSDSPRARASAGANLPASLPVSFVAASAAWCNVGNLTLNFPTICNGVQAGATVTSGEFMTAAAFGAAAATTTLADECAASTQCTHVGNTLTMVNTTTNSALCWGYGFICSVAAMDVGACGYTTPIGMLVQSFDGMDTFASCAMVAANPYVLDEATVPFWNSGLVCNSSGCNTAAAVAATPFTPPPLPAGCPAPAKLSAPVTCNEGMSFTIPGAGVCTGGSCGSNDDLNFVAASSAFCNAGNLSANFPDLCSGNSVVPGNYLAAADWVSVVGTYSFGAQCNSSLTCTMGADTLTMLNSSTTHSGATHSASRARTPPTRRASATRTCRAAASPPSTASAPTPPSAPASSAE